MRILVTRPEPDNLRTAAALRARGHAPVLAPLMRIEPVAADLGVGPFAAVLLTSANAARAIATHPRRDGLTGLPLFAVGEASAMAARAAGFRDVHAAGGDAAALVQLVAAAMPRAAHPLLYLAGAERAADVVGALAARQIAVQLAVVYRAVAQALPEEAAQALRSGAIEAVLHFSRRSALAYCEAVAGLGPQAMAIRHYCLAEPVAAALRAAGAASVTVAPHPDEAALLQQIGTG